MTFPTLISYLVGLIFVYMTSVFVLALAKKDNSIVDVAWGLGFVLIAYLSLFWSDLQPRMLLLTALVTFWGLRLAFHIHSRNKGKGEDFRYKNWRKQWGKWFVLRSFLQVFMLQGAFMLIIALPIYWTSFYSDSSLTILDFVGIAIFAFGFYFEAVGDFQLSEFKKKSNKGKIMNKGLWRYTRHPNYFGESVIWFGIAVLAMSSTNGYYTLIGPLVITFLLLRVSGVTMLEKKYKENKEYKKYVDTTSAFIPLPPKK